MHNSKEVRCWCSVRLKESGQTSHPTNFLSTASALTNTGQDLRSAFSFPLQVTRGIGIVTNIKTEILALSALIRETWF